MSDWKMNTHKAHTHIKTLYHNWLPRISPHPFPTTATSRPLMEMPIFYDTLLLFFIVKSINNVSFHQIFNFTSMQAHSLYFVLISVLQLVSLWYSHTVAFNKVTYSCSFVFIAIEYPILHMPQAFSPFCNIWVGMLWAGTVFYTQACIYPGWASGCIYT